MTPEGRIPLPVDFAAIRELFVKSLSDESAQRISVHPIHRTDYAISSQVIAARCVQYQFLEHLIVCFAHIC